MRPFHHNSNMGRGGESSGPMLTEHLRDLDLELELLKRKRQMIEKQQSLLNQQQAFNLQSYNYDQPQSYREQHYDDEQFNSNRDYSSSSRNFSHLYNEPHQSRDRFPRQSAKKRLGDYVWSDPPIKRSFGGPSKFGSGPPNKFGSGPAKKFGSGPSPKQSKYVPPADRPVFVKNQPGKPKPSERFKAPQKSAKPKPNDFKPTKVVKPKTAQANKPSTFVPKQFAAEAVSKSDAGIKPILYGDQAPTPQMAGRLELALGNILKVIKDAYSKDPRYKQLFAENSSNRVMKQEIRERIRKIMIGKPVGHVPEIIQIYREAYPNSTDEEIVEIGMTKKAVKATGESKFNVVTDQPTLSPYTFFKRNFSQLLSKSVNKVFAKVEAIAREEALQREKQRCEEENKTSTSDEATAPAEENKTEGNEVYDPEIPTEEKVSEETEVTNEQEVTEETKITDKSNSEDVSEVDKSNNEDVSEVDKSNSVDVSEVDKSNSEDVSEVAKSNSEDVTKYGADVKEEVTEIANGESAAEKPKSTEGLEVSQQHTRYPIRAVRAKYEHMMDELMPKKLALWLPKLKWQVLKILQADYDFKMARRHLVEETEARLKKEQNPETSTLEAKKPGPVDSKRPKLKYYVKIQGRPMLPKKPLMQPFLDQFNPKVVKRIKSLRNLLFVGFENKADFDRIVAANGTVVGTDKIIVKISQWVTSEALNAPAETTSTPNTSATSDGDATMKDAEENADDSTELNASLNNQIDELLTSIRNEEETGGEENNETTEAENAADDNADADGEDEAQEGAGEEEQPIGEEANNENGAEQECNENDDQEKMEANDKVEELKSDAKETGRATPTRASTRLATSTPTTPSTIRTRRASRLAQN